MDSQTLIILIFIGLTAGIASGFIGIGGGIVIIPALIYFLGLTQFEAQGVSLTLMLPPIGVLAFYNYYQQGHLSKQLIIFEMHPRTKPSVLQPFVAPTNFSRAFVSAPPEDELLEE